jgi:hypothetical protein
VQDCITIVRGLNETVHCLVAHFSARQWKVFFFNALYLSLLYTVLFNPVCRMAGGRRTTGRNNATARPLAAMASTAAAAAGGSHPINNTASKPINPGWVSVAIYHKYESTGSLSDIYLCLKVLRRIFSTIIFSYSDTDSWLKDSKLVHSTVCMECTGSGKASVSFLFLQTDIMTMFH